MSSIAVTPMEPGWYGVQVTEGDVVTSHRVSAEPDALERLGPTAQSDPVHAVREAIAYCLDRMPAAALTETVSLSALLARYPDFADEMTARTT